MRVKYVGPHEAVICEYGRVARDEFLDVPDDALLGGDFEPEPAEHKRPTKTNQKEGD